MEPVKLPEQAVPVFDHPHTGLSIFLMLDWNFLVFHFSLSPFLLSLGTNVMQFSLLFPIMNLYAMIRCLLTLLSSRVSNHNSLSLSLHAPIPSVSLWPLTDIIPVCPYLSCAGKAKPGETISGILSAWVEQRSITSLNLPEMIFLMQPRVLQAIFSPRAYCWPMFHLMSIRSSRPFYVNLL